MVIARIPDDAGEAADPLRELRAFRWGLLPFWANDIKLGAKLINARAETVHEKPAYRRAFKSRRALIPVDAFYEWPETDEVGKSGKKLKQPFAIPVNCTKRAQPGRSVSEGTWCDAGLGTVVGGGPSRSAQDR
ncbi:SOS response-associated peptidase [Kribbella sp. NBC_01484]|uniref:SOS response-associated peptidase family protein n=1 Tax=Kribbella sp. NBC_01484 TaxID=2903579 RepID=UPI002E2ED32A|nr:SOS response-associated peptidase family protein [Kribbella sp. NBC_01484]